MADETDDLLARIDAMFPPEEASVELQSQEYPRDKVQVALRNRFRDALSDLGLEALVPSVHFVDDGPVIVFPTLTRKEFDRVLLRLEDIARERSDTQQGRQGSSLFTQ